MQTDGDSAVEILLSAQKEKITISGYERFKAVFKPPFLIGVEKYSVTPPSGLIYPSMIIDGTTPSVHIIIDK